MAEQNKGPVATGASLMWRHQRVLWWVFVVNLVLGGFGVHGAAHTLHQTLRHSLAGKPLTNGFDVGMFFELVDRPEVNLFRSHGDSLLAVTLFLLFMLFVSGGILEVYREDRKLTTGEFFAFSGAFFWRFVRLMLLSLIPFAALGFVYSLIHKLSDYVDDRAVSDQAGFYVLLAGIIVLLMLALGVRVWFDIAQIRAVVQNERGMWRNLWKAWRISWQNHHTLFRTYFCISFLAWVTLAVGLFLWVKLPPTALPVSFVLLEVVVLVQIATRLWQRASAVSWYQGHALEVQSVDYTTPHPVEVVDTTPGDELPPLKTSLPPEARSPSEPNPNPGLPPLDV
jgi:hypothetical protein